MVTVVVMLFLIATVVFALSQMLNVSSGNVIDGQRQGDSTAAFFLAESGIETAQGALAGALTGNITNAACTGVAAAATVLGRGTVTTTAESTPANCDNGGVTPCTACKITATGIVGAANRQVTREFALAVKNGTICNAATSDCSNTPTVTWQLNLRNASGFGGIGIFELTYDEHGGNRATCAAASNCRLQVDLTAPSAGQNAVGTMTNAVQIPAGSTYPIYQTMSLGARSLAEVGAFFVGTGAVTMAGAVPNPTASETGRAAFWNAKNSESSANTVGNSGTTTGATSDGTANNNNDCIAPSPANNSKQSCTSWCYGGDTLVYAFSAKVSALTDQLASVTFGTNTGVGHNAAMTRVVKYPNNLVVGAPTTVDAEIWYARNPNLAGTALQAAGVSSYKGRGTGAVGAAWTTNSASDTSISGTTLTVGSVGGGGFAGTWPAQIISVGDTVTSTGVTADTTIVQQLSSFEAGTMTTGRGGRGTYQVSISQTVAGANNRAWTVNSNVLNVAVCTTCFFAQNDAVALGVLSAGRTINAAQTTPATTYGRTEAAGGLGRYPISGTATRVASGATLYAGTPGTTLYLPQSSTGQPAVTTPAMLLTRRAGIGDFASGSTVTATSAPNAVTNAFAVSAAPTTALDGATVCAGTCALFVPGTVTNFALGGITGNFYGWASGFVCLKGVDVTPQIVTSTSSATGRWTEVIR